MRIDGKYAHVLQFVDHAQVQQRVALPAMNSAEQMDASEAEKEENAKRWKFTTQKGTSGWEPVDFVQVGVLTQ